MRCGMTIFCLAWFCITSSAKADVTIEVIEPKEGKFLVTYDLKAKYPADAYHKTLRDFKSYDRTPAVVSITEKNTGQEIKHDIVPSLNDDRIIPGKYDITALYNMTPIPRGWTYYLEFKVFLYNKEDSFVDEEGRWVFQYRTIQKNAFFIIPENHAVVYSNLPVQVYENKGRTVLHAKTEMLKEIEKEPGTFDQFSYKKTLIFKTKEFVNSP